MKQFLLLLIMVFQSGICMGRDMGALRKLAGIVLQSATVEQLTESVPEDVRVLLYDPKKNIILLQEDSGAVYAILKSEIMKPYFSFGKMKMTDPLAVAIGNRNRVWESAQITRMSNSEVVFCLTLKDFESRDILTIVKNNDTINSFWKVRQ